MEFPITISTALAKLGLFALFIQLIALAVFFWLLYLTIRAGVRDGIKQAKDTPWYKADDA